jgi:RIO kinase 1
LSERKNLDEKSDAIERKYEESALFKEKNKENYRVLEEVFDHLTIQAIHKMYNRKVIDEIHGVVNAGKEARVYWATGFNEQELAIKIYYTHTADFRKGMMKYLQGDPRFKKVSKNVRSLIYTWNQKEFSNLKLAEEAGVNAPRPIDFYRNVLVMTFIGENGFPASLLKDIVLDNYTTFYHIVLEEMKLLYSKAGLVHGDLSEYNIMVWDERPVLFDLSQAMLVAHPIADTLIQRDITNITNFFQRNKVATYSEEIVEEWIKGGTENLY